MTHFLSSLVKPRLPGTLTLTFVFSLRSLCP